MIHILDCVTLGGGASEAMGFLGDNDRRFRLAMSRGMAGRIVICHRDFYKPYSAGIWKTFLTRSETEIIGDSLFRRAWEGGEAVLKARFDEVRRVWEASGNADV